MKILLIGAGASVATKEVELGHLRALRAAGHQVLHYALDARIDASARFLRAQWRRIGAPRDRKPLWGDVLYHAGVFALERALRHQVDGALIVSGMYLPEDLLILLRRAGIRTGLLLTESPYDFEHEAAWAAHVDVAWTNERTSVLGLRQANPNVHYLQHAYDPAVHTPDAPLAEGLPAHDVVFVGTGFEERVELLEAVDWTGIDLGLYGTWRRRDGGILRPRSPLLPYVRAASIPNPVAVQLYRRAKIGLNLHRTSVGFGRGVPRVSGAESLNPRAYELAACGVFQITDWRAELEDVFLGYQHPFGGAEDLGQWIRTYLADDATRRAYADAAREVVRPHTFAARTEQLVAQMAEAWGLA